MSFVTANLVIFARQVQAGFHTPIFILVLNAKREVSCTHPITLNLKTDGQLIVHGQAAFSTPSLTASLAAVFLPVDNNK